MTRQAFAAFAGSSAFAAFAGFDDFSVFVAMTWVHIDLVLLVDLVRLVRNVAVWFPHPYATIHLEIILRLNCDTIYGCMYAHVISFLTSEGLMFKCRQGPLECILKAFYQPFKYLLKSMS